MLASHLESAGGSAANGMAPAALGSAGWLGLAATPTFASMALITVVSGGQGNMLCGDMDGGSFFSGMVPMYALMSAFHLPAWLRLIPRRGSRAHPS